MNSQSTGRTHRPKGLKVKPAFQIALLLAVCFWLLYQVKHSHDKDNSEGAQNKASEEHGYDILGRKGNAGWSKSGGMSGSEDANLVGESIKKEDGGGGDDVQNGNVEETNEEESFHEVTHGNLESHEGNEIERETEMQYKELNKTDDNSDVEVKGNDEPVGHHESSLQEGDSREGREDTQAIISDQGGEKDVKNISHDEGGEDERQKAQVISHDKHENEKDREKEPQKLVGFSTNKDISVQHSENKSGSLRGPDSVVDGVHGFDDKNGVPLDGSDVIESIVTGSSGDRAIVAHQDMNSSSKNQPYTKESAVNEEIASKEGSNGADSEAKSKIPVDDTKPKVETSSEIGVHTDASGIDSVSENKQGGSSVSDS